MVIHSARITISNTAVGRLRVDPLRISAAGGPLLPMLLVPLELEPFHLDGQILVLERLEASLWRRPESGSRVRLAGPAVTEGSGGTQRVVRSLPQAASADDLHLGFPLADGGVRVLDDPVRGALGHVIELELSFEVRIAWQREILNDPTAPDLSLRLTNDTDCCRCSHRSGKRVPTSCKSSSRATNGLTRSPQVSATTSYDSSLFDFRPRRRRRRRRVAVRRGRRAASPRAPTTRVIGERAPRGAEIYATTLSSASGARVTSAFIMPSPVGQASA
jgi:hypothetical protein